MTSKASLEDQKSNPTVPNAEKKPSKKRSSTQHRKARHGKSAELLIDVYINDGSIAKLYDQSIPFLGCPEMEDLVCLQDGRSFEVSAKQWLEGGDGVFRLVLMLNRAKLDMGTDSRR